MGDEYLAQEWGNTVTFTGTQKQLRKNIENYNLKRKEDIERNVFNILSVDNTINL